ncbi:MAG TPA: hypothetical protein PK812_09470 [Beijerinckiaceae bacterium]|nr:hypothetical protein [Beijerinckiaceae bacterium]
MLRYILSGTKQDSRGVADSSKIRSSPVQYVADSRVVTALPVSQGNGTQLFRHARPTDDMDARDGDSEPQ